MSKVTPVQQAISIPSLFAESELAMARKAMEAWAKKQNKCVIFDNGHTYIAIVDGNRYRFQCQRYTEGQVNGYGFQVASLQKKQNITGVLLFRQSKGNPNKYLWKFYDPEEITEDRTQGRRTIYPDFDENSNDFVMLKS
jgi:hypothetical protein